jgi:hypothetical protein
MLLRRNIVIDTETAQLVVAAVQADTPPRRRGGVGVLPPPIASRCSDNGSCPARGGKALRFYYSILAPME